MAPQKRQQHDLTQAEDLLRIIRAIPSTRDALLIRILFETGCSASDLACLCTDDLLVAADVASTDAIRFLDPERASAISSPLAISLASFIAASGRAKNAYLFSQQSEKPFSVKRIEQILDAISEAHGVRLAPQTIRYLHIVHAAQRGLGPDAMCAQTGLSRARIIQILDRFGIRKISSYSAFFEGIAAGTETAAKESNTKDPNTRRNQP